MSLYVYIQVPGADPSNPGTQERIAVEFEAGSLPKLQSFKSAVHSNGKYRLLVGGRYIATAQSACILIVYLPHFVFCSDSQVCTHLLV